MADEYPQIYMLQQWLKNSINNTAKSVSETVSKINDDTANNDTDNNDSANNDTANNELVINNDSANNS